MKSSIGHVAQIKSSAISGLILGEVNVNNTGWKAQFSLDDKVIIEQLSLDELEIGELKNDESLLFRLTRDITSDDTLTRHLASEILCYFIEEYGADIEIELLKKMIIVMTSQLSIENDTQIGMNLCEGIFEFIYLHRIDKLSEFEIVTQLANLNKDYLHTYLDEEEYIKIDAVREYFLDKTK